MPCPSVGDAAGATISAGNLPRIDSSDGPRTHRRRSEQTADTQTDGPSRPRTKTDGPSRPRTHRRTVRADHGHTDGRSEQTTDAHTDGPNRTHTYTQRAMDIRFVVVSRFTFRAEVLMALPPHSQGYRQRNDSFLQRLAEELGYELRSKTKKANITYLPTTMLNGLFPICAGALQIVPRNISGLTPKDDTASETPRNGPH